LGNNKFKVELKDSEGEKASYDFSLVLKEDTTSSSSD